MQVLERLDPDTKYAEGTRGACLGFVQLLAAGKAPPERLGDVLGILRGSAAPEAAAAARAVAKWAAGNGFLT
jgi:hypothetical protein